MSEYKGKYALIKQQAELEFLNKKILHYIEDCRKWGKQNFEERIILNEYWQQKQKLLKQMNNANR